MSWFRKKPVVSFPLEWVITPPNVIVRNSPEPRIVVEEHDIDIPPDTTATGVLRIIREKVEG